MYKSFNRRFGTCNKNYAAAHNHIYQTVFYKKNKSQVNLYNIASVQYNYLCMITSRNWLKRIVNIAFKINCFHFIFVASFHRACVYLSHDFRTANLSF